MEGRGTFFSMLHKYSSLLKVHGKPVLEWKWLQCENNSDSYGDTLNPGRH